MTAGLGSVLAMVAGDQCYEFHCENERVKMTILEDKIIRIQATRDEEYRNRKSVSRVLSWKNVETNCDETTDGWVIRSPSFSIEIRANPFSFNVIDSMGNIISEDCEDASLIRSENGFECRKKLDKIDAIYGLGEKAHGLNKKGHKYEMWNTDNADYDSASDPLYQSVPFFIALRGGKAHGVFLDNTFKTYFDFGCNRSNSYSFGAPAGSVDYYIILGPNIAEVIEGYTSLTGKPHFVPQWALGYQQSRWMEYEKETDILEIAEELRNRRVPCDTIVLDIGYMDSFKIFTWNSDVFRDPLIFTDRLRELGFRVMAIIDPGVKLEAGYSLYDEGITNDYFLKKENGEVYVGLVWPGETVFPDFSRKEVREWFGSKYETLQKTGLSHGSWIDMNEPSYCIYEGLEDEYSMRAVVDEFGELWEPRLHNVYGLQMAQAVFEGLKKLEESRRPFILTRAGFAGIQRYAAMWTGDNQSNWEHLKLSIPMLLNIGLSGIPICGADVGGFSGDVTPELLVRWYQVGCFYPFFRNHSRIHTSRQEPWVFGEEIEAIAREYIELRYKLLRYFYALAWASSITGQPIFRPLVFDFQEDPHTYNIDTQFMIGSQIMVAPILEAGCDKRTVYFPKGIWYELSTGDWIEGSSMKSVNAPIDVTPIFIRGGSIIPVGDVVQNCNEDQGNLVLWVFSGGVSELILYEDDGQSEGGGGSTMKLSVDYRDDFLQVNIGRRIGEWKPNRRRINMEIKGLVEIPSSIHLDGVDQVFERGIDEAKLSFDDDGQPHVIEVFR